MYALNLAEDNRILSACVVLPNGDYGDMPIVKTLPDGDVSDYIFMNGICVYDPLPEPEHEEPEPTLESRVCDLESDSTEMKEVLEMLLSGVTE